MTMQKEDYEVVKEGKAIYDEKEAHIEFNVNVIPPIDCWRLVHDGMKVLNLFEADGKTTSIHTLFAGTYEECIDEINRLGLEYDEKSFS